MLNLDDDDPVPAPSPPAPKVNGAHAPVHAPVPSSARPSRTRSSKDLPHSLDSETAVLSCLALDPDETFPACAQLTPRHFHDTRHGILYDCMRSLRARSLPVSASTLAEELRDTGQLPKVGGFPFVVAVTSGTPTTAEFRYHLDRVLSLHARRAAIETATHLLETAYDDTADPSAFLQSATSRLQALLPRPSVTHASRPLAEFTYPEDDDPDILLGHDDYLGRGGGMLFVSHAGAGKSSWIMDACMSWSIGQSWCGIPCSRPLRCLIVQGEDSNRYVGKVVSSFIHARRLSVEQRAVLSENCHIVRVKGISGPEFFSTLSSLVAANAPDLVVINPLYIYAQGDIGRSEFAQPFLCGLDAVNKAERFAYILVHHTGKPAARDKSGRRPEVEDWESVYQGFGSSYLANWPRCSALLEPVPNSHGRFLIKLGKGGYNAGVSRVVDHNGVQRREPTTRIPIRHSTERMTVADRERPVYYWVEDATAESSGSAESPSPHTSHSARGGRPTKYAFSELQPSFPLKSEPPIRINELHRRVVQNIPGLTPNALYNIVQRFVAEGSLEAVCAHGETKAYRLAV